MKQYLMCLMLCAFLCAPLSAAAVPADLGQPDSQWFATPLAGVDTGVARVGWRNGAVSIFGQGVWLKDVDGENVEAWGTHAGATYDVVKENPVTIATWTIPVTLYLGAIAGAVKPENSGWQTSPGILLGSTFGSDRIRVAVEGWYLPGDSVASAFANITSKGRLLVGAEFRW